MPQNEDITLEGVTIGPVDLHSGCAIDIAGHDTIKRVHVDGYWRTQEPDIVNYFKTLEDAQVDLVVHPYPWAVSSRVGIKYYVRSVKTKESTCPPKTRS
jgi:hypothetical protein